MPQQLPPPQPWTPRPEDGGGLLEDLVLAAPRGIAGAAQGVYGLADTLTGDSLPDWKDNPFGHSSTFVGGLAEGAAQFATGFIPVVGIGRWAGLLGKAGWAAEGAGIGRAIAGGAIADFAVWQGHQDRLSNLIEQYPSLSNPVTEFLANDPNDPELLGRLKGAIEGAGLGLATDAVFAGIKKMGVFNRARSDAFAKLGEKATPEAMDAATRDAAKAAEKAVPEAEIAAAHAKTIDNPFVSAEEAAGVPPSAFAEPPSATKQAKTELGSAVESKAEALRTIGLSEQDIKDTINTVDSVLLRHSMESTSVGINPRNLSGPQILNLALSEKGFNLEHYDIGDRPQALIRAYEELFQAADKGWKAEAITEQSFAQQAVEGIASLADITGAKSTDAMHDAIAGTSSALGLSVRGLSARVYGMRTLMASLATSNVAHLDKLAQIADGSLKGDHNLEMAVAIKNMQVFTDVSSTLRGAKAEIGRALGGMRQDVRARALGRKIPTEEAAMKGLAADAAGSADSIPFNEWRNVNPRDLADRPEEIKRLLDKSGGAKNVETVLKKMRAVYANGGEEGLASFGKAANSLMKPLGRRIFDGFMEFWINALVSGPKTAAVNGFGPLAYSYFKPLEAMTGSAILGTAGGAERRAAQFGVARELYSQLSSMTNGLGESVQTAKRLGWNAPDVFDSRSGTSVMDNIARRKAISAANFPKLNQEGMTAQIINWFGNVARVPSGVLGTTDNILKTLNYRAAARGRIEADLIAKGTAPELLESKVAETMDRLIWDHQVYSQNQLLRRGMAEAEKAGVTDGAQKALYAMDYANAQIALHPEDQALADFAKAQGYDATLTTPAAPGSWSASIQNVLAQHPTWRLVVPFVNTPINIMKATGQRFDAISVAKYFAGQLTDPKYFGLQKAKSRFIQEMMSNDPRLQAEAVGRIATGMGVATTAYTLVAAGYITGGGPSDPAHRKTLMDAGWLPYSFRTSDGKFISYARIDPLASMIGTMADIYEYSQYAPHGSDTAIGELSLATAAALANNMTNKTYLTGIANFVDMARQPDKKIGSFFRSYAGSLVPNILGQATGAIGGDETLRDVNSMLDAAKNKIPGLSKTLPPQRNALGEPMTRTMSLGGRPTDWWLPVGYREVSDDKVKREMAATGHAFSPPQSTYEGLDLNNVKVGNTTAYDRWGELQGTVKLGGMTLKDALRKVIASPAYQKSIPTAVGETESPRVNMLNSMIYRFRDAAWRQLLKESPELDAHARNVILNKLAARRGDLFAIGQNQ